MIGGLLRRLPTDECSGDPCVYKHNALISLSSSLSLSSSFFSSSKKNDDNHGRKIKVEAGVKSVLGTIKPVFAISWENSENNNNNQNNSQLNQPIIKSKTISPESPPQRTTVSVWRASKRKTSRILRTLSYTGQKDMAQAALPGGTGPGWTLRFSTRETGTMPGSGKARWTFLSPVFIFRWDQR